MLGKTFFNKFKQNKRNLEKHSREVMAPGKNRFVNVFFIGLNKLKN